MKLIILHNNERTLNKTIENSERLGFESYPINNGPRYKTLIKGLETASDFEDEWFALMGGDQFLLDNVKKDITQKTKNTPKNVWVFLGIGFDYLWQRKRMMAPLIYRRKHLPEALKITKKLDDKTLRPEGFILRQMQQKGYSFVVDKNLEIANHDFEQYYQDIYKKGYFQAYKCVSEKNLKRLSNTVANIKNKDMDHFVFFCGIGDFIKNTTTDVLHKFKIKEKNRL